MEKGLDSAVQSVRRLAVLNNSVPSLSSVSALKIYKSSLALHNYGCQSK